VVGCGNFVALLVVVTYSNTFTPYEHIDVVADEVVLALNAVLTVYLASDIFNDAVCAAVRNEPVSSLVKNEPVASLIALIELVKYSKLPSNSAWVSERVKLERRVRFAIC
jgi:hypothetical protein